MFLQVGNRLAFVPGEHINVYTLIEALGQLLLAAVAKTSSNMGLSTQCGWD
jgi:hypothetical protein